MTDSVDGAAARHGTAPQFSYASDELESMSGAVNYYGWIVERFRPFLGRRILEVGAGIGTFSEYLLRAAPEARVTLLEPAENNLRLLTARFVGNPRATVMRGVLDVSIGEASQDSVVAVNVLEHVPDDRDFVAQAHRALVPGGHLVLFVPAGPGIFGTLDEAFEHHRRYTREGLRRLVQDGGFEVVALAYSNLPGVAAWWLSGKVLRRRTVTSSWVRLYDRLVIPWVRALERRWEPPRGQSLLVVGRKAQEPPAKST